MSRILIAPGRYVQGAGAIHEIGVHASRLGTNALVTGGATALSASSGAIQESLGKDKVNSSVERFGGECCDAEIRRLVQVAKAKGADLIIAVGGGKAIDTGKAVAHEMKVPVIVVPTIAATDAPCSALSVVYTEEGVFPEVMPIRFAQVPPTGSGVALSSRAPTLRGEERWNSKSDRGPTCSARGWRGSPSSGNTAGAR